ncbi:MAG: hypothetical protein KBC02_02290 [Candidatus Pacebacteria bacterium]|nr:hypothetical protein [Candidatus Paceibacterota bacterium]
MPSPLENPFRPPIPTVVDYEKEAHAIGLLLGPKAEAAYRKRHAHDLSDPSASVSSGLTAEEQAQMNEKSESQLAYERKKEQIRAEWGKFFADAKLENADELLDSMEIHPDGSVSLTGKMYLDKYKEKPPIFPTRIRELTGILDLGSLTSAKDLIFPITLTGELDLGSLTSAKDLIFPITLTGNLNLGSLTSAKDLIFPITLTGDLYLNALTSTKDLVLPATLNGELVLNGLISAEHLVLPKSVGRKIYFWSKYLPQSEFNKIRASRPDLADKMIYNN